MTADPRRDRGGVALSTMLFVGRMPPTSAVNSAGSLDAAPPFAAPPSASGWSFTEPQPAMP